jgi:hypothetical protein
VYIALKELKEDDSRPNIGRLASARNQVRLVVALIGGGRLVQTLRTKALDLMQMMLFA